MTAIVILTLGIAASAALFAFVGAALLKPLPYWQPQRLAAVYVKAWDVPTLLGVALLLGVAALPASYLPAHRAASVNPVEALRAE